LDTGVIYRAVAYALMSAGADLHDEAAGGQGRPRARSREIRQPDPEDAESGGGSLRCLRDPRVREALVNFQRQFAADPPGAVLDGRDIGTVICPMPM